MFCRFFFSVVFNAGEVLFRDRSVHSISSVILTCTFLKKCCFVGYHCRVKYNAYQGGCSAKTRLRSNVSRW